MKLSNIAFTIFALLLFPFIYFSINNVDDLGGESPYGVHCAFFNLLIVLNSLLFLAFCGKSSFYKTNRLVLSWIFWVVLSQIFVYLGQLNSLKLFTDIVYVLFWPVCFLFTYKLIAVSPSKSDLLKKLFVLCFFEALILYVVILFTRGFFIEILYSSNEIYYPLLLTPWVFLLKSEKLKFVCFSLLAIAILSSTKRSALLVLLLILLPYYIHLGKSIFRNRLLFVSLIVLLLFVSVSIFYRIDSRMDNRLTSRIESVEEDRGSGRLDIWSAVIHEQSRSSFVEWLFGHGHNSVQKHVIVFNKGYSAHNDYLQMLFDYGIFALITMLIFIYYRFRRLLYLYRKKHNLFFSYYSSMVLFMVLTMVSHLVKYSTYFVFVVVYWAMVESLIDRERLLNKQKA